MFRVLLVIVMIVRVYSSSFLKIRGGLQSGLTGEDQSTDLEKVRIALDWTPNSNHVGFYVGIAKGWFKDAGIDLHMMPPSTDYIADETPARSVVNGRADLCVAPSESAISCWASEEGKVRPIAVATLLQADTSAIVCIKNGKITSLVDLDSAKYASYQGRFEMAIIRQMIKNAGGKGSVVEVVPPKLACFDAVISGDADATWVFMGWEGIQAKRKGIQLNAFELAGSGVPYGYTPVLLASPDMCLSKSIILKKLLDVVERGYKYATEHPSDAALCLLSAAEHATLDELGLEFLVEAQEFMSRGGHYLDGAGRWGRMEASRWTSFIEWLFVKGCLTSRDGSPIARDSLHVPDLFTNAFLSE